jgi:xanthine dehydrogenase molybdenum-binding subunit
MKIIGTDLPIHDAKEKAAGKAVYAGDMLLPGMRHAAMLFSPVPHAIIKSIHTEKALALPGVAAVLHNGNTTDRKFNRYRNLKWQDVIEDEQIFQNRVRFIGDRVACVVADTAKTAKAALALIAVEYGELPFTANTDEAAAGKIDGMFENGVVYGDFEMEIGDKPDEEDYIETKTHSNLARLSHVTMEPHACVADYNPFSQRLTLWSPNQSVHGVRTVIGDLFGIPYHKIRVIKTTMGGSFGSKQEWMLEPVAAAAALATGGPVKLVYSRAEAFASTVVRCPLDGTVTSRVNCDGKILNVEADVTINAGAYIGNSVNYGSVIGKKLFRCYTFPHAKYTSRAVCTNAPVSGAFRSWGSAELAIMLEHNLNMAARRLGMDPVEIRLKNAAPPGTVDPVIDQPLGEMRLRECIEKGKALFEWDKKKRDDAIFKEENKRYRRGIGIGCGGHVNGYFPRVQDFAGAEMRMTEDGGVIASLTLHDHGCGGVTAVKMIIAETLGLPIEKIHIGEGDSDHTPFDLGCLASRTVYVLGRTAADCAVKLNRQLVEGVAELHQTDPESLAIKNGFIYSLRDGAIRYSYGEAATAIMRQLQREIWATHRYINKSNPGVTGAHFAHVEVDVYTGMVKILDYVAVHDIGRAINREMCHAQIQGAVQMGCGAALSEALRVDSKTGKPVTSLKDYHVMNAPEVPFVRVALIEDGGTDGPFGAKGLGEASMVPVAPAVIGAVNGALGSELCSLPLHPDVIVSNLWSK